MKAIAYLLLFVMIMVSAAVTLASLGTIFFAVKTKAVSWWLDVFGWLVIKIDER